LASEVESRLSLVLNRSLLKTDVENLIYSLSGEAELPGLEPWLFYRDNSHVVHLTPDTDWSKDSDYTLELSPGLVATDGRKLETETVLNFSTKALLEPTAGCACTSTPLSPLRKGFHFVVLGLILKRRRSVRPQK